MARLVCLFFFSFSCARCLFVQFPHARRVFSVPLARAFCLFGSSPARYLFVQFLPRVLFVFFSSSRARCLYLQFLPRALFLCSVPPARVVCRFSSSRACCLSFQFLPRALFFVSVPPARAVCLFRSSRGAQHHRLRCRTGGVVLRPGGSPGGDSTAA